MIRVMDNGPGIPLEHQPHVFRRFYRGCSSGARRGLGLGLSIADALLRSQRGQIHLASEPGNGCCFTLTLPLLAEPGVDAVCTYDSAGDDMTVVPDAV
jgi:two-component system OmpR family sensor kinase